MGRTAVLLMGLVMIAGCSRSSSAPDNTAVDASAAATADATRPASSTDAARPASSLDDPLFGLDRPPLYPAPSADLAKTVAPARWFEPYDPIAVAKGERFVIDERGSPPNCRQSVTDDKGLIHVEAQEVVGLGFPTPGRGWHTLVLATARGQSTITLQCTEGDYPRKQTIPLHVR